MTFTASFAVKHITQVHKDGDGFGDGLSVKTDDGRSVGWEQARPSWPFAR